MRQLGDNPRFTVDDLTLISTARETAHRLLDHDPERLRHSEAVAVRAEALAGTVGDGEAGLLVAAAWLHDVGYSVGLTTTGFHPLDGARHLRLTGWGPLVCDLVAHHSGSRFVAHVRGLDGELGHFTFLESPLSDALTIADQTVGPDGRPVSLEARMRGCWSGTGRTPPKLGPMRSAGATCWPPGSASTDA